MVIVRFDLLPFACQLIPAGHLLLDRNFLEGREPVVVVPQTRIVLAPVFGLLQGGAEALGPFRFAQPAGLDEIHDHGEGLRLPRLGEDGPLLVAG